MNINLTNREVELLRELTEREIGSQSIFIKILEEDLEELEEEIAETEDMIEQRLKKSEELKELLRKLWLSKEVK